MKAEMPVPANGFLFFLLNVLLSALAPLLQEKVLNSSDNVGFFSEYLCMVASQCGSGRNTRACNAIDVLFRLYP